MSVIVLKYNLLAGTEPEKIHIKLFKNRESYNRFVTEMNESLGESGSNELSSELDNRATRTIKKLMGVPKRKVN